MQNSIELKKKLQIFKGENNGKIKNKLKKRNMYSLNFCILLYRIHCLYVCLYLAA